MTNSPDVLVVGAGIIGAACALRLTEEGMSVAVVDRHRPAGGTTAAAMGQITVMDDSDAQGALTLWSQELWDALAPSLSAIEHDPCGTLWVATNDEELDEARKKEQWYAAYSTPVRCAKPSRTSMKTSSAPSTSQGTASCTPRTPP